MFRWTKVNVDLFSDVLFHGFTDVEGRWGSRAWSSPTMAFDEAFDIVRTVEADIIGALFDLDTIEFGEEGVA